MENRKAQIQQLLRKIRIINGKETFRNPKQNKKLKQVSNKALEKYKMDLEKENKNQILIENKKNLKGWIMKTRGKNEQIRKLQTMN